MPARTVSEPSNPRARGNQAKLTLKQRRLIAEFEEIAASIQMDYWNILDYREDGRTVILELMKQQLIRSEIITRYTLIDEYLSVIMCHYYFKIPKQKFTFQRLWRAKKKAHPVVPGWSICSIRVSCAGDLRRARGGTGWRGRDR